MGPTVYFVIPCYSEEQVLPETVKRLTEKLRSMEAQGLAGPGSRMLLVDDGSKDKTWELISRFNKENPYVEGVKLSHNRGHQNALLCGLMTAKDRCDCAISLDADLQDDTDALDQFVQKYLEALAEYREVNLFLRGIVPLIGYRSDYVYYDRHERFAGESKYPLKKMISFALDGITSFSVKPLKLISNLGILISLLSVVGLLYALISFFAGWAVPGWTATVCSIWLLGGLQMLCLGVVGGYIGKIYNEVKARPRYRVEEHLSQGEQEKK